MFIESIFCFFCFEGVNCLGERGWILFFGKRDSFFMWFEYLGFYRVVEVFGGRLRFLYLDG